MWNPSKCDWECDKTSEIGDYLDIKNCACKEHVIDSLVLTWKDEILNTAKTAIIVDQKIIYKKIIVLFTIFHL